jgi:hypothetical protein
MVEELEQVANIVAATEGAIAELQEINSELALIQMRKHLQDAINLLSEAEESLNELERGAEDGE